MNKKLKIPDHLVLGLRIHDESPSSSFGAKPIRAETLTLDGVARLNLKRAELALVLGSPRLLQRLTFHGWLKPLNPTSNDHLFPVSQVFAIQGRLESGDMPPLLPSEGGRRKAGVS